MRVRLALVACAALLALPAASNAEDPVPTVDPSLPADPNLGEDLILLDDGGIKVGIVKLSIPSGCRRAPFRASVTGSGITRVDFRVDRRLVRSVSTADSAG